MLKTVILDQKNIERKINRIAWQIYESNADEKEIILAGIDINGFVLAEKIAFQLKNIAPFKVLLCKININKSNVFDTISTSLNPEDYKEKSLVLIDDVLHTGLTLMYAVKHFLNVPLKQLKTAVLVDRNHKKFPIKVDYKGISLSTSFQNNVEVIFSPGKDEAYLE